MINSGIRSYFSLAKGFILSKASNLKNSGGAWKSLQNGSLPRRLDRFQPRGGVGWVNSFCEGVYICRQKGYFWEKNPTKVDFQEKSLTKGDIIEKLLYVRLCVLAKMHQNAWIVDFEANISLTKGCILTAQAP